MPECIGGCSKGVLATQMGDDRTTRRGEVQARTLARMTSVRQAREPLGLERRRGGTRAISRVWDAVSN